MLRGTWEYPDWNCPGGRHFLFSILTGQLKTYDMSNV
jgi:hypothetical protein